VLASQSADAIAQLGGVLEVQSPCRILHLSVQVGDPTVELLR
jgi:hypothetical protein